MDYYRDLAERKITEAVERGEFDNLPGRGQPLNLEEDQHIPVEMRMAYRILKRAGVPPEEVVMSKSIHVLRAKLLNDPELTEEERASIKRKVALLDLELTMKLERFRKQFGGI